MSTSKFNEIMEVTNELPCSEAQTSSVATKSADTPQPQPFENLFHQISSFHDWFNHLEESNLNNLNKNYIYAVNFERDRTRVHMSPVMFLRVLKGSKGTLKCRTYDDGAINVTTMHPAYPQMEVSAILTEMQLAMLKPYCINSEGEAK